MISPINDFTHDHHGIFSGVVMFITWIIDVMAINKIHCISSEFGAELTARIIILSLEFVLELTSRHYHSVNGIHVRVNNLNSWKSSCLCEVTRY